MGTDVVYLTRQLLTSICDGCSLWKGRYDETKCENVHLFTIKGDAFLEAKPWEQKTKQDGLSESFKVITPSLLLNLYLVTDSRIVYVYLPIMSSRSFWYRDDLWLDIKSVLTLAMTTRVGAMRRHLTQYLT